MHPLCLVLSWNCFLQRWFSLWSVWMLNTLKENMHWSHVWLAVPSWGTLTGITCMLFQLSAKRAAVHLPRRKTCIDNYQEYTKLSDFMSILQNYYVNCQEPWKLTVRNSNLWYHVVNGITVFSVCVSQVVWRVVWGPRRHFVVAVRRLPTGPQGQDLPQDRSLDTTLQRHHADAVALLQQCFLRCATQTHTSALYICSSYTVYILHSCLPPPFNSTLILSFYFDPSFSHPFDTESSLY